MVGIVIAAFGVVLTALDDSQTSGPSIFDFGSAPAAGNADTSAANGMVQANVPERPPRAEPSDANATPGAKQLEPAASADQGAMNVPKVP